MILPVRGILLLALLSIPAAAPFAPAAGEEKVTFVSGSPQGGDTTVSAQLSLPEGGGPFPAVVLLHTCGGITSNVSHHWPRYLNGLGYATLTVDSFGSRHKPACRADDGMAEVRRRVWDMAADTYAALGYLATQPSIDGARVAVMGFSFGGNVINTVLLNPRSRMLRRLAGGREFAAGVAFYANCAPLAAQPASPFPLIQIIGEKDKYADDCGTLDRKDLPVHIVSGAVHNFDEPDNTDAYDLAGNFRSYDKAATERAGEIVRDFLAQIFASRTPQSRAAAVGAGGTPPSMGESDAAARGEFITADQLRAAVTGNTARFVAPNNGLLLHVYFAEDGQALIKLPPESSPVIAKRWFIGRNDMLCRHVGPENRDHCVHVSALGSGEFEFLIPRSGVRYRVTLLKGRQLPE